MKKEGSQEGGERCIVVSDRGDQHIFLLKMPFSCANCILTISDPDMELEIYTVPLSVRSNLVRQSHGRMNYKDTKPYMSAFLSVDLLTDFAAFCFTDL